MLIFKGKKQFIRILSLIMTGHCDLCLGFVWIKTEQTHLICFFFYRASCYKMTLQLNLYESELCKFKFACFQMHISVSVEISYSDYRVFHMICSRLYF